MNHYHDRDKLNDPYPSFDYDSHDLHFFGHVYDDHHGPGAYDHDHPASDDEYNEYLRATAVYENEG